jgi:cysteine-rich repeat protein
MCACVIGVVRDARRLHTLTLETRNLALGEQCDDGNAVDGDGCDSNCTITVCGNGIATIGEICDDGNAVNGDGCDSNCTITACGNGICHGR